MDSDNSEVTGTELGQEETAKESVPEVAAEASESEESAQEESGK